MKKQQLSSTQEELESNSPGKKYKTQMELSRPLIIELHITIMSPFVIQSLYDESENCNYCRNLTFDRASLHRLSAC